MAVTVRGFTGLVFVSGDDEVERLDLGLLLYELFELSGFRFLLLGRILNDLDRLHYDLLALGHSALLSVSAALSLLSHQCGSGGECR